MIKVIFMLLIKMNIKKFHLDELIKNIDKNRPLRLSLAGVFSELPVPPFVVKEWRSLS